ncbi:hypothetical protein [Chryseobacterium oryzae]|uniref:Lipoprotein n=1 Tax=Chryseobacterium oryzae TaxID=2929799 RepID=A0ABY4BD07_9FLAO|nr:hypothetical protein [Chryseobacterium oryzae]UOE37042.1 hypothetical protein MTP08_08150 [Chryseobacterium oryzae]
MKNLLLLILIIFSLSSCGEECYNAPQPVVFEFVNSNNENLIADGSLSPFYVRDENKNLVELTTTSDHKIIIENIGAYNGTKKYTFYSPIREFNFEVESSEYKGGCNGFQIKKITFTGYAIDITDESGFYKIVLK